MRLIDVHRCNLDPPYELVLIDKAEAERGKRIKLRYAILSHRWEREEVTLKDLTSSRWQSKKGAAKLIESIELARSYKDSSADLSEAINSMYKWYADADVCFAYLSDVDQIHASKDTRRILRNSTWFTRGWTLQELIAPKEVALYSAQWQPLGLRTNLTDVLSTITGIPEAVLKGNVDVSRYSAAERMSWASYRHTEREEDLAYSLMGLFSVNMPLLYGEGKKAFIRLQEEILRSSDDYSIFAWQKTIEEAFREPLHGLLADKSC